MTILTAIMAVLYIGFNIKKLKDREILKKLGINIICILCVSAFFWMPMFETYLSADYVAYQKDSMATQESFHESGLDIKSLLYTDVGNENITHVFEIGIPILVMLILSIVVIKKGIKITYKKEYIIFLILGIICTVITIKQIPWGIFDSIFQTIQFKWRMLLFSNFFLAIICAINMYKVIKRFNLKDIIVISIICMLYISILIPILPKNSEIKEISEYTIGKVTENKKEAIAGIGKGEYLPVKANNNRNYIIERENGINILKGTGKVDKVEKSDKILKCTIKILEDDTILEFPYIYYPGYTVKINGKIIKNFESENGFLAISLPETSSIEIVVEYTKTNVMNLSKMISIISFLFLIGYIILNKRKNSKNNE